MTNVEADMYIGVDIGTTVTKAAGFDADGVELCVHSVPTQLHTPGDGRVEQDADLVLGSVVEVVRAVVARLPQPPTLIALTGQGDGCWLHDGAGMPVRPAVSWLDARASATVHQWDADGTADRILTRNGGMVFPGTSAAVLATLERDEPAALDQATTATHCVGMMFHQLTGVRATDVSDASFPFLDPRTRNYDDDILRLCGLRHRRDLLPPIVGPGGPAAALSPTAGELLGLSASTASQVTVSAGPYDLLAAARGSDVVSPGDGLLIIGTTLACQVVTDEVPPATHRAGLLLGMWQEDRWMRAMPAMVGTASLDWLLKMTGSSHDEVSELVDAAPPGADGVRVLPYWSESGERAPFVEAAARGRFDGLHLGTTRAALVRGLCEAMAFAARHCFEAAGLTGRLAVTGGGRQSAPLMQLFADVLGRPLEVVDVPQAGAYGAVISALEARGEQPDWPVPRHAVEPAAANRRHYDDAYRDYVRRVELAREEWRDVRHGR